MAKIVSHEGNELTLQMTVKLRGSLMNMEKTILDGCNEMGGLATAEALQKFDTDGSPIKLGEVKMTVRDKTNKTYQTPYGGVLIQRNVYQSSKGGKIYCPLENNAQIIRGATPKFAQQISHKYANMNAPAVCQDLKENHHRKIAHSYLQDVSD
ncbi:MAG: ISKra4 family transposase, partial [Cocleimonas sp.]